MNVLSQPQYEYLKGIVTVAINTGLRRQNILDLTWKQIHLVDRVIEITRNKSNKHILKPINDALLEYFKSIPEEKRTGHVFINPLTGKNCKEIKRAWRTVKEKAGIVDFRFHDLRHTVGTRLAQMNVSNGVVRLGGGEDIPVTVYYNWLLKRTKEIVLVECLNGAFPRGLSRSKVIRILESLIK